MSIFKITTGVKCPFTQPFVFVMKEENWPGRKEYMSLRRNVYKSIKGNWCVSDTKDIMSSDKFVSVSYWFFEEECDATQFKLMAFGNVQQLKMWPDILITFYNNISN